ncbi:hypothetical protein TPHA_0A00940 [Tetrapisispora phaffii CBS 4417]|uniref:COX assembly mitochondrial protein n=1 Tax=Tetrapisispora phaffii (strain ATCC 24235 / CBS 4417 / NBRC 1672 / NRRL Y-8282 / UCD 70-5) TaxID=1071381 RepID=G8BMQ1_TETPH|nr:hypothetical protein TPHA_0A00940 [Tetrapisispora phaffii CBS 4417]CCE61179.1 hypothetical protein TPHA_0A00940 [Tetrapisispora phaffii CBS 4417]
MHPQLEQKKFHSCLDFIEALDKCHQKGFYKRVFGVCNNEKDALTECLKEAKRQAVVSTIQEKKEKRKKVEEKWKQLEAAEFGEDMILKKIMEKHNISESDLIK